MPFVRPSWAATPTFRLALSRRRLWIPSDGSGSGNGVHPTVISLEDGSFLASAVSTLSGRTFIQIYNAAGAFVARRTVRRLGEFGNRLQRESTDSRRLVLLSASTDGIRAIPYNLDTARFASPVSVFDDSPAFTPVARATGDRLDIFATNGPVIGERRSVQRISYDDGTVKPTNSWFWGSDTRPEVKMLAVGWLHLLTVEHNAARNDFGYRVRKLSLSTADPVYGKSFRGRDVPVSGMGLAGMRSQDAFALAWSGGGRLQGVIRDASGLERVDLKPVDDPGRIVPDWSGTTPMLWSGGRIIAFSRTGSVVAWNAAGTIVAGPTRLDIGSPVEVRPLTADRFVVVGTDRSGGKSYVSVVSLG